MKIKEIHQRLKTIYDIYKTDNNLHTLGIYKQDFVNFHNNIDLIDKKSMRKIIDMCLDYYTYSDTGETLVDDKSYDDFMQVYIELGGELVTYSTYAATTWSIVKHKAPFMVGSLAKSYDMREVSKFIIKMLEKNKQTMILRLSAKFDGISACLEIRNHVLVEALTRYDGVQGQNITEAIKEASNISEIIGIIADGFIKVELCVTTESLTELRNYKNYSNRRSATSGIINTPKNIEFGRFLTVIPLYAFEYNDDKELFHPNIMPDDYQYSIAITEDNYLESMELLSDILPVLLDTYTDSDFPFRVDGLVIYCQGINNWRPDKNDLMKDGIAYKVNTQFAKTKVLYVYPSIGRTGLVTPMIKIPPTELNETSVEDVNLSNFEKFNSFDIHENDKIIIFHAGDVIPMVQSVIRPGNQAERGERLNIQNTCPYCTSVFEKVGKETYCVNPKCKRIITGRITNFLTKLKCKDVSDATMEAFYDKDFIGSINDIFNVLHDEDKFISTVSSWENFNQISANNIFGILSTLKTREIEEAELIGSLGIPNFSIKKSRNLLTSISLDNLLNWLQLENRSAMEDAMSFIKGFKDKTIIPFVDFVYAHFDEILYLKSEMNLVLTKSRLEIAFTGFRNKELVELIDNSSEYVYSESLNSNAFLLIASEPSKKTEKAALNNIKIIYVGTNEYDSFIKTLKEE